MKKLFALLAVGLGLAVVVRSRASKDQVDLWTEATTKPDLR